MINAVRCNKSTFKTVEFEPGFNVVLADRTKESTKKDSRNGLGKSTLIDIIHFCLGASTTKGKGLMVSALNGWTFSLDLTIAGKNITVSRSIASPNKVIIDGDTSDWQIKLSNNSTTGNKEMLCQKWSKFLGKLMFGLDLDDQGKKYKPAFRSLISYFIRKGSGAFLNPFENFQKQREFDKQISNAFLLNLAWEDASDWQVLKDQEAAIDKLKEAVKSGLMNNLVGTMGELEAVKRNLENKVKQQEVQLQTFKVHPQYIEIENRVDKLTGEIHVATNQNITDKKIISSYERNLSEENITPSNSVVQIYEEAKVAIPEIVKKQLSDVQQFHQLIIKHRRDFLSGEISRLKSEISTREELVGSLTEARADSLQILKTHGALEEYTKLQQNHLDEVAKLKDINVRIENLKKFEQGKSSLRIDRELLHQRALKDYEDQVLQRQKAIDLFNANSEALYEVPGKLIIDITKNGFKFDVEIERSGSEGISHMKVFCYDLMLAKLWSKKRSSPGILLHDSSIFDPVDVRQIVNALELAASQSAESGFQYICALNSDKVPWGEFSLGFDLNKYVCLRLTDTTEDGSLLGIRF